MAKILATEKLSLYKGLSSTHSENHSDALTRDTVAKMCQVFRARPMPLYFCEINA